MVFSPSMNSQLQMKAEESFLKRDIDVRPGDTVKVHLRITEGGKERIQIFEGVVIAVSGNGLSKTITVRKISYGVGVEKIFPLQTPTIKKIDVIERGDVRRAKLYYMRKAVGKHSLDAGVDENFEIIEEELKETGIAEENEAGGEVSEEASSDKGSEDTKPVEHKENIAEPTIEKEEKDKTEKKQPEEPAGTASSDKKGSSDADSAPAQEEKPSEKPSDEKAEPKEGEPKKENKEGADK